MDQNPYESPREATQDKRDALAYLAERKCLACGTRVEGIQIKLVPGPRFRCLPPAPSTWQARCPECGAVIEVHARKGKVWPRTNGKLSRRSVQCNKSS